MKRGDVALQSTLVSQRLPLTHHQCFMDTPATNGITNLGDLVTGHIYKLLLGMSGYPIHQDTSATIWHITSKNYIAVIIIYPQ